MILCWFLLSHRPRSHDSRSASFVGFLASPLGSAVEAATGTVRADEAASVLSRSKYRLDSSSVHAKVGVTSWSPSASTASAKSRVGLPVPSPTEVGDVREGAEATGSGVNDLFVRDRLIFFAIESTPTSKAVSSTEKRASCIPNSQGSTWNG